ncbi:hypothetical protein O181_118833 [Austropuccinia psidii MF-1]|uniref:Uncharacterized protein n=1 Tax=Austropuccinia psidii MF-1 TaxID=1389203 RepID=A0A9Q3KCR0_9BASI|nr:hypothetical protein [Austropuccinia psidii MF-1]
MSIPGALAFSIYVDWFNAHGKSTRLASIGPIMLICLNLPPSERLKPEPANFPSIELPINATHQQAQRAMARLPFFTHLNRPFRILYPCCHSHSHCGCGCHTQAYWIYFPFRQPLL